MAKNKKAPFDISLPCMSFSRWHKLPLIESFDGVVGLISELNVSREDQNYLGDAVLPAVAEKPNIPLGLIIKIFEAKDRGDF